MIRTLLATTALATVLATGAMAQNAAAPAAGQQQPMAAATSSSSASQGQYIQQVSQGQYLASDRNGAQLFAGEGQNAETVGDIQNFLVNADGTVAAVVVDAGEFVGEARTIAIPFDQITWSTDENNQPRATVTASQEQLAQAPAFEAEQGQQAAATDPAAQQNAAQPAAPANQMAAGTAPAAGQAQPAASDTQVAASGEFPSTAAQGQHLTENLIGQSVYSGPGEDAESIGDMNDLILASSGQVVGAVVGVGGFLGIGEKDVGVPFQQIQFTNAADGESRAVVEVSKEQLEQAPEFTRPDTATAGNQMQPATSTVAATGAAAGAAAGVVTTQSGQQPAGATDMAANSNGMSTSGTQTQSAAAGQPTTTTTTVPVQPADTAANQTPGQPADTSIMAAGSGTPGAVTPTEQTAAAGATTQDNMSTAALGNNQAREGMTPVQSTELSADNLMGTTVYGPNDENIGEVGDIALSAEGGVDAIIVDVGGFLGIGAKPVAVAMDNLQFMQDANGSLFLYTQFTQEQLEAAPEYNQESYAQSRDSMRIQSMPAGQQAPAAQ